MTSTHPRIVVVTNGNFFANVIVRPLLAEHPHRSDAMVIVTRNTRKPGSRRSFAVVDLLRTWGLRLTLFKVAVNLLPGVLARITGRPLTVDATARQLGVVIHHVRDVNSPEGRQLIAAHAPDVLVSVSCPYKIGSLVLELASIGSVNVHSSLLPAYAGVSTYIHVLADGAPETGVTVHEMVERFDAGGILAQQAVPVDGSTTALRLFYELAERAGPLLLAAVNDAIARGTVAGEPQDLATRSYRGEPGRTEVSALRARGHRLLRAGDLALLGRLPSDRTVLAGG